MASMRSRLEVVVLVLMVFIAPASFRAANACAQTHPVPLINQPLVPAAALPGGAGFTLTVNGTGFASGAQVRWNGTALATTFVSASQLTASVPASKIATAGTATITVTNPGSGVAASNVVFFEIVQSASAVEFGSSTVATGNGPAAIVAADFNGDGKMDLAVANSAANTVSVLLGNGDGTFATHVDYPTSASPYYNILAADFNNDGKIDIAAGSSVLLGNGDGTFQPFIAMPFDASLAADFNGDGKLDITGIGTNSSGANAIDVALGNGDGTFGAPLSTATELPIGSQGFLDMAVGDFNGDGKLDVAVRAQFIDGMDSGNLFVQLGNGDGTFQSGTAVNGSDFVFFNPTWMGLGDFNGDGKLDIVTTSCYYRDILAVSYPVFLGQGNGAFTLGIGGMAAPNNQDCPYSGLTADLNGDGKLDLAAVNYPTFESTGSGISVLLGNGDGSLQLPVDFPTGSFPLYAAAGDFNADGRLDLAVTNNGDNTVSILLQQPPAINTSPPALTFGNTYVGVSSSPQTLTITNVTTGPVQITDVSTSADFSQTNDCGTLDAGATCSVSVTFTPGSEGPLTGTLTITYSEAGSPLAIPLSGTGQPHLVLSTTQVSFGYHEIGTSAPPQTVAVTNAGLDTIFVSVGSLGTIGFSQTNNCGSLAPGASCQVTVAFAPKSSTYPLGSSAVLEIYGDYSNYNVTVSGIATTTAVVVSPSRIVFSGQSVGSTSPAQNITFANAGTTSFSVREIKVSSGGFYQQTNDCPAALASGASCSIAVTFTPKSEGNRAGFVLIVDSSRPRPAQLVLLTGTGSAQEAGGYAGSARTRLSPKGSLTKSGDDRQGASAVTRTPVAAGQPRSRKQSFKENAYVDRKNDGVHPAQADSPRVDRRDDRAGAGADDDFMP